MLQSLNKAKEGTDNEMWCYDQKLQQMLEAVPIRRIQLQVPWRQPVKREILM